MNERIKELALQADSYALATIGDLWIGWEEKNPGWEDCRDQKFAELLIRECADICVEQRHYQPKEVYAQAVLSHFGVEE